MTISIAEKETFAEDVGHWQMIYLIINIYCDYILKEWVYDGFIDKQAYLNENSLLFWIITYIISVSMSLSRRIFKSDLHIIS